MAEFPSPGGGGIFASNALCDLDSTARHDARYGRATRSAAQLIPETSESWWVRGEDFTTAAVDWVPFTRLGIFAESGRAYAVSIYGEHSGYAEFKLQVDNVPAYLWLGCPRRVGIPVVMTANFTAPAQAPLRALAAFDTPNTVQIFVRTSRHLTLRNWSVVIEKALAV